MLTVIVVQVLFVIWDFKGKRDSFDVVILVECLCVFDAFRITEEEERCVDFYKQMWIPPQKHNRVARQARGVSVGQLLTQVLVLDANAARSILHKLTRVADVGLPVLVRVTLFLPPVHEEENKAAEDDADKGEVVARLLVHQVDVHVASERKAKENGESPCALNEAPAAWKVLGANPLEGENLKDVMKAAEEDPVHPDKEQVSMVAFKRAESENGKADAKDGGLKQVLT